MRVGGLALVFPGQGSQAVGMGRALASEYPECRAVFEAADSALGEQLSRLIFEGPEADLGLTANTQPAILTVSVAAWRALELRGVRPEYLAGHSLGEYSALVAAGALEFPDAVRLVRARGMYMQQAVPPGEGSMAAILGLDADAVRAACDESAAGQVVSPANLNSPDQTVIAGHAPAVERAIELCKARGARRAVLLPVSAPFHCALMTPARDRLAPDLEATPLVDARWPIVTNVDALPARRAGELREALLRQVTAPVRWAESIRRLAAMGVDRVVEVGPGKVLSGLVRRIEKDLKAAAFGEPGALGETMALAAGG